MSHMAWREACEREEKEKLVENSPCENCVINDHKLNAIHGAELPPALESADERKSIKNYEDNDAFITLDAFQLFLELGVILFILVI
jgi:hypothetical protein